MGVEGAVALRLVPFDAADAGIVSSWAASVEEVAAWCSYASAPLPAEVVDGWGRG
jgi:hypothetical protein